MRVRLPPSAPPRRRPSELSRLGAQITLLGTYPVRARYMPGTARAGAAIAASGRRYSRLVGFPRQRSSRRRLAALAVLAAASAFAVGLVFLRFTLSENLNYGNLVWNLVLAWVPLGLALL